ncbi:MAG: winged helix-turn-helix domain-containing protein [Limnochordia bacterium]|jgi:molybdate transport system regulatory protein
MRVNFRLWLEDEQGTPLIGEGLEAILRAIVQTGSINQAAQQLNMSYRRAWAKIKKTEERLGYQLVSTQTGGADGGGSSLTPQGEDLLATFTEFHEAAAQELQRLFTAYFEDGQ